MVPSLTTPQPTHMILKNFTFMFNISYVQAFLRKWIQARCVTFLRILMGVAVVDQILHSYIALPAMQNT
jgi:hypothetical protein